MSMHKLSSMVLAGAVLTTSFVQSGDTAPWPSDWNNWSDPALWVTVGNPNNAPDTRYTTPGYGSVDHVYNIGKFEVTAGQYTAFLNAVAKTDTYGLYSMSMWSDTYGCKIQQSGTSGNYTYSVASDYANRPVNFVSFWDAARFTNWLNNGQGSGDTETGAYTLNGYSGNDGRTIVKNAGTKWWISSENEWYKAAYHKNDGVTGNYFDYPTGTNSIPARDTTEATNPGNNANYNQSTFSYTTKVGEFELSDSPYGTFDQGGNLWEWNDTVVSQSTDWSSRGVRGGSFFWCPSGSLHASDHVDIYAPSHEEVGIGFRVASVPEPGSLAMLAGIALTALLYWWRKRA